MRVVLSLIGALFALGLALVAAVAANHAEATAAAQTADVIDIPVEMDEYSINPRHAVVQANRPVRFVVTGTGVEEHRFNVLEFGERWRSDRVLPGGTIVLEATFTRPGIYQVWCSVGGHKELGSVGTLTVVDEGADAVLPTSVRMGDFWFDPISPVAVAGQKTRFQLDNLGAISHVLNVTGYGLDIRSPNVRPGTPVTWDLVFETAGTYEIWCSYDVEGVLHKDLGMLGALEVLPGGG